MSDLERLHTAPLVRGLFLNALGMPVLVLPGEAPKISAVEALLVELPPAAAAPATAAPATAAPAADAAQAAFDEGAAAAALGGALALWRRGRGGPGSAGGPAGGPAGGRAGADALDARAAALPGCVALSLGGRMLHYYAATRYDAAVERAARGDASAWTPDGSPRPQPGKGSGSAEDRSRVVDGRVALVTGGAQGFGEEISRALVASGALVFVADLNAEGAGKLCAELCAETGRTCAIPVAVNVAEEASVAAMAEKIVALAGGLDLVVSNAGVLKAGSVLEQDGAAFRFVTDVNYVGFFNVTKHTGLVLRRQRLCAPHWTSDIVQINSKSGLEGSNRNAAYAGSKFGGIGLVQSFALELVEYGIKVNAICPGNFFDGPLWSDPVKGLFVQYLRSGKVPGATTVAEVKASYEAKVPMGRGCEGRDVMRALYYLVEQEYETGQALPVTGGQVMLN